VRKILAIVLMGGALIVSASAAGANGPTSAAQFSMGQPSGPNGDWIDQQGNPLVPNQAQ
jgi:hypothetical protein